MAMRARINEYSARPWPSSPRRRAPRNEEMRAMDPVPPHRDEEGRGGEGRSSGGTDDDDRAAQVDQGEDRDDGDEGEDQRVLRETLAFLVTPEGSEERGDEGHGSGASP